MDCPRNTKSVKIDERSVKEQEHRKISRNWNRVVKKHSLPGVSLEYEKEITSEAESEADQLNEASVSAMQRRMAKMKSFAKRKSPLQKFDEIVTRELTNRQFADDESICLFDGPQKWSSNLDFSGRKVSFDTKISKTTLSNVERELKNKDKDPTDVENADLMEAIEKLLQAQASCRFDAAVKAADAAASSVPIDLAEEVAITCAKDYQTQFIDILNDKVGGGDGNKPIEVIGYIGITKKKEPSDDD